MILKDKIVAVALAETQCRRAQEEAHAARAQLKAEIRRGATPVRIVVSGLALGFASGMTTVSGAASAGGKFLAGPLFSLVMDSVIPGVLAGFTAAASASSEIDEAADVAVEEALNEAAQETELSGRPPPMRPSPGARSAAVAAPKPDDGAARQPSSSHAERLAALRSHSRLLGVLVLMVVLYTCYFASGLLVPLVMAAFFATLLSPLINRAPLRWLPRGMAAMILVAGLVGSLGAVTVFVAPPAAEWTRNVPFLLRDAAPKLQAMVEPFRDARRASDSLDQITGDGDDDIERVVIRPPTTDLLSATPKVLGSVLAVLLLTFTFLVYGDDLLTKLLQLRRTRAQKRLTADIVQQIQSDLSRYVLTLSATSAVLGGVTALYLWYLGAQDPLLWGVLAAALNLTPIAGPLVMATLLTLVGLSQFDTVGAALLLPVGYVVFNALESNLLTPMLLGRTMRINPLAIILWLLLWGWLWGVVGLLVAVPMLVCLKIIASRVEAWQRWAKLLE